MVVNIDHVLPVGYIDFLLKILRLDSFLNFYMPQMVYLLCKPVLFYRRITLCDCVERGLKKGRGSEQSSAAHLAPLLCVQLGAGTASEEVLRELRPILSTTAHDKSAAPLARAKVNARNLYVYVNKLVEY